jgi:hypothetical protein
MQMATISRYLKIICFSDIVFDQLTADTQIFANNLSYYSAYYWRVLAYNQIQTSEWSAQFGHFLQVVICNWQWNRI